MPKFSSYRDSKINNNNNHESSEYIKDNANMARADIQGDKYGNRRPRQDQGKGGSWRKKVVVIGISLLVISIAAMLGLTQRRSYYSNKFLAESWHKVSVASSNVTTTASLNDIKDTKELNQQWAKLNEVAENQIFLMGQINRSFNRAKYFDQYNELLKNISNATKTEWNLNLDNKEALNQNLGTRAVELKSINDQADNFAKTYHDIVKDEKINLYAVVEKLQEKVKAYILAEDKKSAAEKEAEASESEKAALAAAEVLAVKEAANNFLSALIKNDDTVIMQSLSSGYKKEFNKEQYNNEYTSVVSYRVIDTKKTDSGAYYTVSTAITFRNNGNTYTNNQTFRVVSESGRWLVDGPVY